MKPICLITPPSIFLLDERVFLTLGILRVAAVLEAAGYPVEMLDLSGIDGFEQAAADHASNTEAEIFGITATTPQLPATMIIARAIREARPEAKIILGGPHITLVNAARKREVTLGQHGRAHRAYESLLKTFDVLVAGDGEQAIFEALAPEAKGLVDADIPSGKLFLTNQTLEELPWPARHLVDVSSYHYTIDNERALSLIAQLGCLEENTCITMDDGRQLPIKDVQKGDSVVSYDVETNGFRSMAVKETWKREALDLYECEFDDGTILKATGEHPIWTPLGWRIVEEIFQGERVAKLSNLLSEFHIHVSSAGEVLLKEMSRSVAEDILLERMVEGRTRRHEEEMEINDSKRAVREVQHQTASCSCQNGKSKEDILGNKEGQQESHEASECCTESVPYYQKALGQLLFRTNEAFLGEREIKDFMAERGDESISEWFRKNSARYSKEKTPKLPFRRQWRFLDWTMRFWEASKSRLFGPEPKESYSSARRVLALEKLEQNRNERLQTGRVPSSGGMVQGTEAPNPFQLDSSPDKVWKKLVRKRFLGKSAVYNLTVHPVHTYFANGILVHNCPFACGFCGGRESPMLRRIRTRSTTNIVGEIRHLHDRYGANGIMFYDDELNVNPKMIELMHAIAQLQEELGVTFKLRGFIKSQLFTDMQAQAMFKAGFRWILVGFESGSERILSNMNKKATRAENTRCMEIATNAGLKVKALMSIGHPGESEETIQDTQDWLLEVKPADFDCTVITTYPGTPYFDHALKNQEKEGIWTYEVPKNGDKLHSYDVDFENTSDYYKGRMGEYHAYVYTDYLESERLVSLRDKVESEVRSRLCIPFNQASPAIRYEHSMGMSSLPPYILKATCLP